MNAPPRRPDTPRRHDRIRCALRPLAGDLLDAACGGTEELSEVSVADYDAAPAADVADAVEEPAAEIVANEAAMEDVLPEEHAVPEASLAELPNDALDGVADGVQAGSADGLPFREGELTEGPVLDGPSTEGAGGGGGEAGGGMDAEAYAASLEGSGAPDARPATVPAAVPATEPSEPWLSVGVGTLRTLTGHGNGSPVDSNAVVTAMRDLGALGNGAAQRFDRTAYPGLVSTNPAAPFTGQGATGVSPLATTVPVTDLAAMARYHQAENDLKVLEARRQELQGASATPPQGLSPELEERRQEMLEAAMRQNDTLRSVSTRAIVELTPTVRDYRNPLSDRPGRQDPRDHFDDATREQQARLLLEQPITTLHREAYGDRLPTRGEVISAAAEKYRLDPAVLGGVILHEQRDQSRREDSADLLGSTLAHRDTSLGLGQILMSTAIKDNNALLADTVDEATRSQLTRDGVARLLTSDEHNIMATARYLRLVADKGADIGEQPGSLRATRREFPGLDTDAYRTSAWGPDNVRAIASEYTSKPWDDRVIGARGYPTFVLTAVEDIRRAKVFGR